MMFNFLWLVNMQVHVSKNSMVIFMSMKLLIPIYLYTVQKQSLHWNYPSHHKAVWGICLSLTWQFIVRLAI